MKIKSLLLGMLACSSFVACTNEETPEVNNGGEKSYVAVNIVMPGDVQSRADDGYEAGTDDENAVADAVFLFLDKNFNGCADPCVVDGNALKEWSNATGDGEYQQSKAVLVINNGDKQVPSYIVAVLNPKNARAYNKNTSLATLKAEKETYTSLTKSGEFVMSNSVYVGANGMEVAATPISIENVKSKPEDALENPVTIYVERVVGKVEVDGLTDAANNWTTEETYENGDDMGLTLQITGWEVLQNQKSTTVKNISTAWDYDWWNAPNLHRSFWAIDAASERTEYMVEELKNNSSVYVEETVNQTANTDANGKSSPYLLVSGKFVDEDGIGVELVEWRGYKYTKGGYLNLIAANSEVSKYWYKEGESTYTQFGPELLKMTDEENDWQATATLTNEAEKITFGLPTFDANGNVTSLKNVELKEVKDAVAAFGKVQYWNGGNTYYYVPITHQVDNNNNKYYGVVRNHVYKVTISEISGFGTPVANPEQAIDIPETPTDDNSYLAAKVVVLKWRVVENNNVQLGNDN